MKTLITANDIRTKVEGQEKVIYVDSNTIITPAAKDAAKQYGIDIVLGPRTEKGEIWCAHKETVEHGLCGQRPSIGNLDEALIAKIVGQVVAHLTKAENPECQDKEIDISGLWLARRERAIFERIETADPACKAKFCSLAKTRGNQGMEAGLIMIESSGYFRTPDCEELICVLTGSLTCSVDHREYKGKPGDVFHLPPGLRIALTSSDRATCFFVSYAK